MIRHAVKLPQPCATPAESFTHEELCTELIEESSWRQDRSELRGMFDKATIPRYQHDRVVDAQKLPQMVITSVGRVGGVGWLPDDRVSNELGEENVYLLLRESVERTDFASKENTAILINEIWR